MEAWCTGQTPANGNCPFPWVPDPSCAHVPGSALGQRLHSLSAAQSPCGPASQRTAPSRLSHLPGNEGAAFRGLAVTPSSELHPEHHKPRIRVPSAHVVDELDLFRLVLVRMAVRAMRTILERLHRTVIALHPTVDVLPVCPVPDRRCCDAVLLRIFN